MHLAVDASINFSPQDFEAMKDFLKATVDRFIVSKSGAHFSASVFGDDAEMLFNFHQGNEKADVIDFIDKMTHRKDTESNMDKVARLAATEAFSIKGGIRQGVPKVFLLITAGDCRSCKESLLDAVAPLEEDGVQIVTLAVGNKVDVNELQKISSKPVARNFFRQASVLDIRNPKFVQKLSEEVCKGW